MTNTTGGPKNRITDFETLKPVIEDVPSNTVFGQNAKGELTMLKTECGALHILTGFGPKMMQPLVVFKPRDAKGNRECTVKFLLAGEQAPALGIPTQLRTAKIMQKWFGEIAKALEAKKVIEEG